LRLDEGELVVSKVATETRLLRDTITAFGLILLSLGSIIAVLLNVLLGMFFVIGGIVIIMIIAVPPGKKIKRILAAETVELEKPEEMQLCPQCNKKISKTFKKCPYCRSSLKNALCPYCKAKLKK